MACPDSRTKEGFETQLGVNHLAHFLLFQLLQPTLLKSATPAFNSRVVALSSSGHRTSAVRFDDLDFSKAGYDPWLAYGQSKTANVSLSVFDVLACMSCFRAACGPHKVLFCISSITSHCTDQLVHLAALWCICEMSAAQIAALLQSLIPLWAHA